MPEANLKDAVIEDLLTALEKAINMLSVAGIRCPCIEATSNPKEHADNCPLLPLFQAYDRGDKVLT